MNIDEVFKIATAVIASVGGSALILAAFSSWLGGVWAKRMLQNERAKHSEALEGIKKELDLLKQKEITRHFDKLAIYKDVVHLISEILRELEAVTTKKQRAVNPDVEHSFALCRNKAYGYLSLVSTQEVMDKYNEMIDFFIPIMYEGQSASWEEMREKADALLNTMRLDLGIKEGDIVYRGSR
ncbi:hypothetical protein [Shewanella salipaludis]|uniref:DUF4760 domain-containing protein n=1 Tax=Shewanella salipaludis TaxID=2723052 RepID=A0A972JHM1_9GAMM|nr:hypothetical protein [Shewanella salipaludis]NMH64148.1 hypothetical protein [Shewanella salipaludis]